MMRTIRFQHPQDKTVHLGVLVGDDDVYSITGQVPDWTCPVPMWYALRALGIPVKDAVARLTRGEVLSFSQLEQSRLLLPPVVSREVWASGVTYERSRNARNAETQIKESVYDLVYDAARPELFFKATYERIVPAGHPISVRQDSKWMVPEPELAIVISATGNLIGYTIGNDVSARDIEGENPLYLPQAKVFANSCAVGPVLLWSDGSEDVNAWTIGLTISRGSETLVRDRVSFQQFRRTFTELVAYLLRDNIVYDGTVLLTGTGIVPPDEFSLSDGDVVEIEIQPIGVLRNAVGEGDR